MKTRVKVAGAMTFVSAFSLVAFLSMPVAVAQSGTFTPPPGPEQVNECAQVFQVFPQNGTVLINENQGSTGFRMSNFSLTTAFQFWWGAADGAVAAIDQNYTASAWTNYLISGNVDNLTASNDALTLTHFSALLAINGSRDSQFTGTGMSATLSQHNSSSVAIAVSAKSFDAAIGPVLAKSLNMVPLSASFQNFTVTILVNCSTGAAQYTFAGEMSGIGALGAILERAA